MPYNNYLNKRISLIVFLIFIYFVLAPLEDVLIFSGGTVLKYISFAISVFLIFEVLLYRKKIEFDALLIKVICLIILSWLSLAWSINIDITLSRNVAYTLLPLFFIVVYISNISGIRLFWLDHAIIFGGVLTLFYLLQSQGIHSILSGRLVASVYNDPNNFSAQLFLPLALTFKYLIELRGLIIKFAYGFFFLILLFVFMLTGSRGGLVSLLAFSSVFVFFSIKQGNFKKILVLILTILILVFVLKGFIPETIFQRLFSADSYLIDFEGTGSRSAIWRVLFQDVIPFLPLWGVGSGCSHIPLSKTHWFFGIVKGIHNTYIDLFIEYGVFGLSLFLFFVASLFKKLFIQKDVYRICILTGILVIIFFLDSYSKKYLWNSFMYCSIGMYRFNRIKDRKSLST